MALKTLTTCQLEKISGYPEPIRLNMYAFSLNYFPLFRSSLFEVGQRDVDLLWLAMASQGDTLYSISKKYNVSIETIQRANGIDNPDFIQEGNFMALCSSTYVLVMKFLLFSCKGSWIKLAVNTVYLICVGLLTYWTWVNLSGDYIAVPVEDSDSDWALLPTVRNVGHHQATSWAWVLVVVHLNSWACVFDTLVGFFPWKDL